MENHVTSPSSASSAAPTQPKPAFASAVSSNGCNGKLHSPAHSAKERAASSQLSPVNLPPLERAANQGNACSPRLCVLDVVAALISHSNTSTGCHDDAPGFVALLRAELAVQNQAISAALQSVWRQLLGVGSKLSTDAQVSTQAHHHMLHAALQSCDAIGEELLIVLTHVDNTVHQLAPLCMMWDEPWLPQMMTAVKAESVQHLHQVYCSNIKSCLTGNLKTDAVLLGLSDCYASVRRHLATAVQQAGKQGAGAGTGAPNAGGSHWRAPDQFRRKTTKYWARMEDVHKLSLALLRHLPMLVFGRPEGKLGLDLQQHIAGSDASVDAATLTDCGFSLQERSCQPTESCVSSAISSIYFDALQPRVKATTPVKAKQGLAAWISPKQETPLESILTAPLPVYHYRLRREDKSSLVRLRWYGEQSYEATGKVFVERKLHREAWTGEDSVKERFQLPIAQLPAFLKGEQVGSTGSARSDQLKAEVQTFLTDLGQGGVLRTTYNRCAFQRSDTNAVRVSLDTQVVMSLEPCSPDQPWANTGSSAEGRAATEVVHFPYAILEVKLQDGDQCPDWVLACVKSGLLVEVPKFSKFLHGMALLYSQMVRNTPAWFVERPVLAPSKAAKEMGPGRVSAAQTPKPAACDAQALRATMQPATIQEVALASQSDDEGTAGSWWFGQRLTDEQLHDAQPEWSLPADLDTGDVSCAACSGRNDGGATGHGQQHTCALGKACQLAGKWRMSPPASCVTDTRLNGHHKAVSCPFPFRLDMAGMPPLRPVISNASASLTSCGSEQEVPDHGQQGHGHVREAQNVSLVISQSLSTYPPAEPMTQVKSAFDLSYFKGDARSDASDPVFPGDASDQPSRVEPPARLKRIRGPAAWFAWVKRSKGARGDEEAGKLPPAMIRSRIEPKTFFAAERTFLSWLNLGVLLMFLALSLLTLAGSMANRSSTTSTAGVPTTVNTTTGSSAAPNQSGGLTLPMGTGMAATASNLAALNTGLPDTGSSPSSAGDLLSVCGPSNSACRVGLMAGALLAPVALLFMCYALVMYRLRTVQILKRETVRYDDQRGPIILVVLLITLLGLSYGLSIKALSN